jgi:hypothetical protein
MSSENTIYARALIPRAKRVTSKKAARADHYADLFTTSLGVVKVQLKASELAMYLRSQKLTRKSELVYDNSRKLIGRIQGLQTIRVKGQKTQMAFLRQRAKKNRVVSIIFDDPLTEKEPSSNIKTKKLMATSTPTASVIKKFDELPAGMKKRVRLALRIELIHRLKKEPFQKVAKSCPRGEDEYVASFKDAGLAALEAELQRLRGLRK